MFGPFLAGYRKAGGPLKCKRPVLSAFQDEAVDEVEDPTPEMSIESQETLIEVPGARGTWEETPSSDDACVP